ncbi:MAG: hypothetical protein A3E78_02450 [Alphaproteobacteria bacterium RIFCSPHIGHO2_12_FULL_63_12]|nr:MAG: hypothetical protein A3E78_02450 [Alphaproteobacteria bacterium RIFCSPHIGHO2_12_FULL_63_12]
MTSDPQPQPSGPAAKISGLFPDAAPTVAAFLAFLTGAATIISAANPGIHPRAVDALSLIAVEAPSMIAALVGIGQMALADGLRRRIDASMWAACLLSLVAAAYFILHHERLVDAAVQITFAVGLIIFRRSFYRRARAFSIRMPPLWFAGVAATLLVAVIGAVLWAATHPAFRTAPWQSLLIDPVIGRAGRPVAVAGAAFVCLAVWRYLASVERTPPTRPGPDEYSKAWTALEGAAEAAPESILAFSGDLALLFSDSGRSFIPYAAYGSSLFALAGPAGPADERRAMLASFCERADRDNLKPVVYAAPVPLLPDLLDLGFKVEKIGENAVIDLPQFSLAGKARESIRYANRKLTQREGAHFEMHAPPHAPELIEKLRPVSDAWLQHQKTGEKRFSLGRFEPRLLARCLIAEARVGGRPVAFGTILATPGRARAALDLMRYDPSTAPPATMDFLLSEILLWAKDAGFQRFDLSMAPLSGLAEERFAPLFARLGRMIFEQGGRWYNFEGLRKFKEKYKPDWEPRYLAARGAFSLPLALAEVAMLTNSPPPERAGS